MTLLPSDRVFVEYYQPHRNDGVNEDDYYSWFRRDVATNKWEGAKWIELEESFLSYGHALSEFLGSESVGRGLIRLDMPNLSFDDQALTALANNPAMTDLETLNLGSTEIEGDGAFAIILASPYLRKLKTLSISQYGVTADDVGALEADERVWQSIAFKGNYNEDAAFDVLFESNALDGITTFGFINNILTEHALNALKGASFLATVKHLRLEGICYYQDDEEHVPGLEHLSALFDEAAPYQLETLSYCGHAWDEVLAGVVERWPALPNLRKLNLSRNRFSKAALDHLLHHPVCHHLTTLVLNDANVQAEHLLMLATTPHFSSLQHLFLDDNEDIGDAGAQYIAESQVLTALKTLEMKASQVSHIGHRALTDSSSLTSMRKLSLGELVPPPEADRLEGIDKIHYLLESGMLDGSPKMDLNFMTMDEASIELLSTHPASAKIGVLELVSTELTDDMLVKLLSDQSTLTSLGQLYVDENQLTNGVCARIAPLDKTKNLNVLSIMDNQLGYSGARELLWCGDWTALNLEGNKSPEGDNIYDLIDDYWTSSIGDVIDLINERR